MVHGALFVGLPLRFRSFYPALHYGGFKGKWLESKDTANLRRSLIVIPAHRS